MMPITGGAVKFGFQLTAGDPATIVDLSVAAEAAGWDAVFYWDGISVGGTDVYDPWVVMTGIAARTERIRFGPIVTPPPRRRPWKLARETMTLDRLSGGRLILPVGLGALDDQGFGNVGEQTEIRVRAELLDESLAILDGLWSGEPFSFEGRHYSFGPMKFRPTPVQRPRIPIWVIGVWPHRRSLARAFRWDGILPQTSDPETIRQIVDMATRERAEAGREGPWDVIADGWTSDDESSLRHVAEVREAGATWWVETDWNAPMKAIRSRIAAGPPLVPEPATPS
jgi:alkanesulfonate monooxygenase SsuD/methylene tetrahydromethanopterin reductase-like flavin-dependent oxidoreductase (luciferase family)